MSAAMELGHRDRRRGKKRGPHLMTSSKGVKMTRVLTVEFGNSIMKGLM